MFLDFLNFQFLLFLFYYYASDTLKIALKSMINELQYQNDKYGKFKNFEREIKPPLILYSDFERTLVLADNGKQNPNESYTNKHQDVACSYGYKVVYLDDKFSKPINHT